MTKEIIVFRYGHRIVRDYRVTSHCSLVARAFGASRIIVAGEEDKSMKKSVEEIVENWGGKFKVEFIDDWKKELGSLKDKGYYLVHLTMYGEQIHKSEEEIRKNEKVCLIIGSQKVDADIYKLAHKNVSVTTQPHSEIAALSVSMDRIFAGNEFDKKFLGGKKEIIPQKQGKKVIPLK
jgi:tRNA (cytidine56-2'-O)-methyltransferase